MVLAIAEPEALFSPNLIDPALALIVDVSSASTRGYDVIRKRAQYQAQEVPEYWFVDLDADHIEVYRLDHGVYPSPTIVERGDVAVSANTPGLRLDVDVALGLPPSGDG